MRSLILILLAWSLTAADAVPAGDEEPTGPKSVSAEESAKILADIKAKKAAKAAAQDPAEADAKAAKQDDDMHKFTAKKDEDEHASKISKATRDAEALETKAKAAAKNAVRQHDQFMVRAKAEHDGRSDGDIYRVKVVLHESGATNQAVIDAVDKAKEFLSKCDEARTSAGLEPLLSIDKRGKQRDAIDWILENGK